MPVDETYRELEQASIEVQRLVDARFVEAGGAIPPGSPLDQAGLRDGADIVRDYLHHGEWDIAFDHLMYMVTELDLMLLLSPRTLELITRFRPSFGLEEPR